MQVSLSASTLSHRGTGVSSRASSLLVPGDIAPTMKVLLPKAQTSLKSSAPLQQLSGIQVQLPAGSAVTQDIPGPAGKLHIALNINPSPRSMLGY